MQQGCSSPYRGAAALVRGAGPEAGGRGRSRPGYFGPRSLPCGPGAPLPPAPARLRRIRAPAALIRGGGVRLPAGSSWSGRRGGLCLAWPFPAGEVGQARGQHPRRDPLKGASPGPAPPSPARRQGQGPGQRGRRYIETARPSRCRCRSQSRAEPSRAEPSRALSTHTMAPRSLLLLLLALPWLVAATATAPGCKIRITGKGLDLVKQEGLRFVEQELENISIPDLQGKEGQFHYNISQVKVMALHLALSDLHFQPQQHIAFSINNASISLRFRRQLLYWFFYDVGSINASALGVHVHTALKLSKDRAGRLKISNITCNASIARMQAGFSGTLRKVYEFLGLFLTTGMRFVLNQQICPALNHAGLVLLNSLLDTVPVRNPVDEHVGIDYSLLSDPVVTWDTLDMDFRGMFFYQKAENQTLVNKGEQPEIKEMERMVYVAFSEYFFDSAMFSYFQAGVLTMEFQGDQVPKDLEVLLRATFFGSMLMMSPAVVDAPLRMVLQVVTPPRCTIRPMGTTISVSAVLNISLVPAEQPPVQLSSMSMEARLSAKVMLRQKALQVQLDLRRFRIYSKQSALESLALFSLQTPLKTLLQLTVIPIINERTRKGVQIPLPEGMDFTKEVVTNHLGYITVGADLHFSKGLREVIENYRPAQPSKPSPTA